MLMTNNNKPFILNYKVKYKILHSMIFLTVYLLDQCPLGTGLL